MSHGGIFLCGFQHKAEREWILRFLGERLHDKHCDELDDYQRIFQVILSFSNSPLCDEGSQVRVSKESTKETPNHRSLHGFEISSTKQKGAAGSAFAFLEICSLLVLCVFGGGNHC